MSEIVANSMEFIVELVDELDDSFDGDSDVLKGIYVAFVYLYFYYAYIMFNLIKDEDEIVKLNDIVDGVSKRAVEKAKKYADVYKAREKMVN